MQFAAIKQQQADKISCYNESYFHVNFKTSYLNKNKVNYQIILFWSVNLGQSTIVGVILMFCFFFYVTFWIMLLIQLINCQDKILYLIKYAPKALFRFHWCFISRNQYLYVITICTLTWPQNYFLKLIFFHVFVLPGVEYEKIKICSQG